MIKLNNTAKYSLNKEEVHVHPLQTALEQHDKLEMQRKRMMPQQIFGSGLIADLATSELIVGSRLRLPGLPESFAARDLLEVNGESSLGFEGWMHEMRMGGDEIELDIHSQTAEIFGLNEIKF